MCIRDRVSTQSTGADLTKMEDKGWDMLGVTEGAEEMARALDSSLVGSTGRVLFQKAAIALPMYLMRLCWMIMVSIGSIVALCVFLNNSLCIGSILGLGFRLSIVLGVGEGFCRVIQWKLEHPKSEPSTAASSKVSGGTLAPVELEKVFHDSQPVKLCLQLVEDTDPNSSQFMSVEMDPITHSFGMGLLSYSGSRVGLRQQADGEIHESCTFWAESSSSTPGTLRLRSVCTDTLLTPLGGWGYAKSLVAWKSRPLRAVDGNEGGADEEFSFERCVDESDSQFEVVVLRHLKSWAYLSHLGKTSGFGLRDRSKASKFVLKKAETGCEAEIKREPETDSEAETVSEKEHAE
eukprot:TRINITY_DN852_c0_g1_i1.p1 TRINITY_DN852_c0_g1~~TRINITY_DN852_c0_g1_i1.p1  ORF type:complete len:349 (-),score=43.05 TRINITY_DN852_c0_g1_i1:277-1323(-)